MLTAEQTDAAATVRARLISQGVSPVRADAIVGRATSRVAERSGLGACATSCCCDGSCLGDTTTAAAPTTAPASAPASGTPQILSALSTAGNDPTVVAMQNIVSKWSWVIPVGGLLMSAKSKFTDWRASKTDPAYSAAKSLRSR